MDQEEKKEILNLLQSIPSEFRLIEEEIKEEAINQYYDMVELVDFFDLNEENPPILRFQNKWKALKSREDLKILLVKLSEIGDISSYRTIEAIIKDGDPKLKEVAHVALKFARLHLENKIQDEPVGFISSELGGKENKLRYYFAIKSKEPIINDREFFIEKNIKEISIKMDSELEEIENHGNYILIKILVSMDVAIGNVIENLITRCEFIEEGYLVTNVEKPTKEFIEKWMNGE